MNEFSASHMAQQITENVQRLFDHIGINEKVGVDIEVGGSGRLTIRVHTTDLITYEILCTIEHIVWMLTPPGIMHEVINVATTPTDRNQKLLPDGIEFNISVAPDQEPDKIEPKPGRVFANINTSDDVTMLKNKKKGK